MTVLSKIGTALVVVFVVSLLVLLAEILYVVWRRRRFVRPATASAAVDVEFGRESKELLYFLCWKNQPACSRVEPAAPPLAAAAAATEEEEDEGVQTWRGVPYGQSRVLFTIKEDEKEEMMETENVIESEEAKEEKKKKKKKKKSKTKNKEKSFPLEETAAVVDDEVTPFATPSASPPYYTPSPSPSRDIEEQTGGIAGGSTAPFTGIEVQS